MKLKNFTEVENNVEQTKVMMNKLLQMVNFCETTQCRRQFLMNYFGEEFPEYCGSCDVCLSNYETVDGTIIAQKALSAVKRLESSFGINYVVDFLRGSKSEKIWEKHKSLKTYGVGADFSKEQWIQYFRSLISKGYLQQDVTGKFPVLKLTEKSNAVLKGLEKVMLVKSVETKTSVSEPIVEFEKSLLEEIKSWRYNRAKADNIPPYIVFADSTLTELATYLPINSDDLMKISGFGEFKMQKYGEEVLKVISNYCQKNNLGSRIGNKIPKRVKKEKKMLRANDDDTRMISYDLFKRRGKTIAEIATFRNLKPSTIEEHLSECVELGLIDVENLVDKKKIPAINKHGHLSVGVLKNELGSDFSYHEIRSVISFLKWKKRM